MIVQRTNWRLCLKLRSGCRYLHQQTGLELRQFQHLHLLKDLISKHEEDLIVSYLNPVMARKRYEGNHWDDVIAKYKEMELSSSHKIPSDVNTVFRKIEHEIEKILGRKKIAFMSPHVIDLAKEGHIAPHVDSIKFSGDIVAGLSLQSLRIMELTLDKSTLIGENSKDRNSFADILTTSCVNPYPNIISFELPPRSLYILTGPMRYNYAHAVHGINKTTDSSIASNDTSNSVTTAIDRRLSVIFRNIKDEE